MKILQSTSSSAKRPSLRSWKWLAAAGLAASLASGLGGCAGGATHYYADQQPSPGHPFSNNALADAVYLDGTGPSARQVEASERYQAPAAAAPARAVARSRPLAIEREARSDAMSGTTGMRSPAQGQAQAQAQAKAQDDPNKPYTEAWWQRERAAEARLKASMSICRGC